jgi:hypothetical protein
VTSPIIEVKQVKQVIEVKQVKQVIEVKQVKRKGAGVEQGGTKRQPFPTLFYLTLPSIVKAVSRLEANGVMEQMNSELNNSAVLRQKYERAHKDYLARRESLMSVPQIENFSAGGMPKRIKCLHALIAHSLAVGDGINPFGDRALHLIKHEYTKDACSCKSPYNSGNINKGV